MSDRDRSAPTPTRRGLRVVSTNELIPASSSAKRARARSASADRCVPAARAALRGSAPRTRALCATLFSHAAHAHAPPATRGPNLSAAPRVRRRRRRRARLSRRCRQRLPPPTPLRPPPPPRRPPSPPARRPLPPPSSLPSDSSPSTPHATVSSRAVARSLWTRRRAGTCSRCGTGQALPAHSHPTPSSHGTPDRPRYTRARRALLSLEFSRGRTRQ
jgi:hypothetical protein